MRDEFLAHIAEDGRKETVLRHLTETADLAAVFADAFGAGEQGRLAGMAHDIGKYSTAFQKRLHGDPHRVDHSTAGAVECLRLKQLMAALAVAGHHGGLPEFGSKADNVDQPTLCGRFNRARQNKLPPYDSWQEELKLPNAQLPNYLRGRQADPLDMVFFTRMLYSCLVDADFLCTERFMAGKGRDSKNGSMDELNSRLDAYTAGWFPPRGELNTLRCSILRECRERGSAEAPGLFSLTVPTGGGKTVSSLAFALSHAAAHHMQRIIYVIPYTSIIEQNAAVFRKILGDDVVLEHHSGVLYDLEQEADPETVRMAQATENWDMPVVVTTAVQFFESLFSDRPSKCRKLHNLADSVIIFDEAQMLPIPMLRPCVHAISQLVAHFRATAVLCTATQPALQSVFEEFLPGTAAKELCPREVSQSRIFQRVSFRREGKLSWDQLAEQLNNCHQVLCIVNSRKGAREVFNRLLGDGCFHLSTLMYPDHRTQVLEKIRRRLKKNLPCRVVSTSLIEAGVDVDFPLVYREEAGLDSVLQAAGRCNREGKRSREDSTVTVFRAETPPPQLFSASIYAGQKAMDRYEDISSQEAVHTYFQELLDLKGNKAQDMQQILPLIREHPFPFPEIAERFRMIDHAARTIYIPLGEGKELTERLQAGERNRNLFRRAGKYSVSAYEGQFRNLEEAGALQLLEDGSAILLLPELYDLQCGLAPNADSGNAYFV